MIIQAISIKKNNRRESIILRIYHCQIEAGEKSIALVGINGTGKINLLQNLDRQRRCGRQRCYQSQKSA